MTVGVRELSRRRRLWAEAVGPPVALDLAPRLSDDPAGIDVVSWNVAIGRGRLDDVVARIRTARPLVVLVQEAYRSDDSVPEVHARRAHGGRLRSGRRRRDIVAFARDHGLSLRYVPSMRNARSRSDRGNAVLSTVALEGGAALVLPHVRQRRVAVAARLAGLPDVTFVSAHLDTPMGARPGRRAQAHELARAAIAHAGDADIVLGADLNALLGRRDPVVRPLLGAGFEPAPARATFRGAAPLVLPFDHLLVRSARGCVGTPRVQRLAEDDGRPRRTIFGSDHHPLVALVPLAGSD